MLGQTPACHNPWQVIKISLSFFHLPLTQSNERSSHAWESLPLEATVFKRNTESKTFHLLTYGESAQSSTQSYIDKYVWKARQEIRQKMGVSSPNGQQYVDRAEMCKLEWPLLMNNCRCICVTLGLFPARTSPSPHITLRCCPAAWTQRCLWPPALARYRPCPSCCLTDSTTQKAAK